MPTELRVFVNERPFSVPAGATVADAVRLAEPALLPLLADGGAFVTDGRGIEVAPDAPLTGGAILRAQRASRRG